MTAITQVQETLELLKEELEDIRNDTENTKINATAGGTVKIIYAQVGENVQDVMLRDGALAVVSLDGLMAVRIQRNTKLTGGDKVCVTLADDTELEGRVASNLEGVLTVTVEDKGFEAGQVVKVTTEDGDRIGSGTLYINSPWNVVAYSGTVLRIQTSVGATVSAGQRLFELKNEGHTAQFDSLSRKHREYEELMLELFKMYQTEQIVAPCAGMVSGVDKNGTYMLSDSGNGWKITLLANGPGGDENSYINYIGQVKEVGIDGLVMNMNPQAFAVTDYFDLSGVPLDTKLMTESTTYIGSAPIYMLSDPNAETEGTGTPAPNPSIPAEPTESVTGIEGTTNTGANPAVKEWVQISPYAIEAGDILLFAGDDSGVVWVVKFDIPKDPFESTGPSGSGGRPQGGMPSIGGGMPGMGQQESDEYYALDTVAIASVTAQETVTISITVDELDVRKLFVGQETTITVEALPGRQFPGTVTGISASGENSGGNSKFTVTVTLDKIAEMLPGMSASVSIMLSSTEQVISIPVAALIERGTETLVYRSYNEETEEFADPVAITTGVSDGEYVQILTGISAGEKVYYPYYDTLVTSNVPQGGSGFPFG